MKKCMHKNPFSGDMIIPTVKHFLTYGIVGASCLTLLVASIKYPGRSIFPLVDNLVVSAMLGGGLGMGYSYANIDYLSYVYEKKQTKYKTMF